MQLSSPGAEQKTSVPAPPSIASQPPASQPQAYSTLLGQRLGIQMIQIINNEVISAGQLLADGQLIVLVHCRVTPALLEFTIRSPSQQQSAFVIQQVQAAFR